MEVGERNLENITLGQITDIFKFILEFAGMLGTLYILLKNILNKSLEPIKETMKIVDINQCKNFLVRFLADVERGEVLDDVEIKRAYDAYDHYTNELKQNSYIHDKWEKLMK